MAVMTKTNGRTYHPTHAAAACNSCRNAIPMSPKAGRRRAAPVRLGYQLVDDNDGSGGSGQEGRRPISRDMVNRQRLGDRRRRGDLARRAHGRERALDEARRSSPKPIRPSRKAATATSLAPLSAVGAPPPSASAVDRQRHARGTGRGRPVRRSASPARRDRARRRRRRSARDRRGNGRSACACRARRGRRSASRRRRRRGRGRSTAGGRRPPDAPPAMSNR